MLAKIDIQSAFCLLPVHLEDCHLLTMGWKERYTSTTVFPLAYNHLQNCSPPWLISFYGQHKMQEYCILSIIWMIT